MGALFAVLVDVAVTDGSGSWWLPGSTGSAARVTPSANTHEGRGTDTVVHEL